MSAVTELLPVLFRGHAHVFLEYLDEIALRAETEQAADRGGSVLGVLEQVLGSFYFFNGNVFADAKVYFGLKQTG